MNRVTKVPPIKSQGIKTKLVPWIKSILPSDFRGKWIEPFMGTGVVAFNVAPPSALLCDTNPHLINFYSQIATKQITPSIAKAYLVKEGDLLLSKGEDHYYYIRDRFNDGHAPLDFLFLNRAGFNGMIRFNRKGGFNIPFCRKPARFAQAYVTKIVNQIAWVSAVIETGDYTFACQDFQQTLKAAGDGDIVYCDPPYIGRHVDYFNSWDAGCEQRLFDMLDSVPSKFILSTWHHNDYRSNEFIDSLWSKYSILTKEHFYHVGASEDNRNPMVEALITSFVAQSRLTAVPQVDQLTLLSEPA
jgi:DNA adenine methylase